MAIAVAYDICREVCEGNLDPAFKVDKPVSFFRFREKLAKQMLHYSPKHRKYPGDNNFRCATQQPSRRRTPPPAPTRRSLLQSSSSDDASTLCSIATRDQVEAASDRLCGDLDTFEKHEASMTKIQSYRSCIICGKSACWCCNKCPNKPVLHRVPPKRSTDNISCHIKHHNSIRYGITRAESSKRKWKEPSAAVSKAHAKQMKQVCAATLVSNAVALPSSMLEEEQFRF